MALADDIRGLEQQTLAALDSGYDYYVDTKMAWRILQQNVKAGQRFRVVDPITGAAVEDEKQLLQRSQHYVTDYLAPSTFQHFVSLFEHYVFELMRHWLIAFPKHISAKTPVGFSEVLRASDKSDIIATVVDKALNDLKYKPIGDWFERLESMVAIGCPTADEIEALAEIKATRDIVVHNNGIANVAYIRKAGGHARAADGELLVISEPYHRESWETVRKVVVDVSDSALAKAR